MKVVISVVEGNGDNFIMLTGFHSSEDVRQADAHISLLAKKLQVVFEYRRGYVGFVIWMPRTYLITNTVIHQNRDSRCSPKTGQAAKGTESQNAIKTNLEHEVSYRGRNGTLSSADGLQVLSSAPFWDTHDWIFSGLP